MKSIILNVAPRLAPSRVIYECTRIVDRFEEMGAFVVKNNHSKDAPHLILAIHLHILSGLHRCPSGTVFVMEHDVLYPDDWMDYEAPTDGPSYHGNGFYYSSEAGFFKRTGTPLSTLAGDRDYLIKAFTEKVKEYFVTGRIKWSEPKNNGKMHIRYGKPYIDIRHGGNITGGRAGKAVECPKEWKGFDFNVFNRDSV